MAFNGSGVFVRLYNWVSDAASAIKIRADRMDNEFDGIATGLSNCITKDGQTTVTANLPMATYRHTNVGNGASRTDYASLGQTQDGKLNWVDGGGTADAITAGYSIPITALVDGQICFVRATAANATTTPTFSPNGLTARTIVKNGGSALVAGDISGDGHELILRYDLSNTRWELLNPKTSTAGFVTETGSQTLTNKTLTDPTINILDNALSIKDNSDATKIVQFQVSGLTTATTRTLTVPDANITLAGTNLAQSYSVAQRGTPVSLTQAATIAVDLSLGNHFYTTMTDNRTLGQPTNMVAGQSGTIEIIQDGTGSRTLAYHADWLFPSGSDPVLSTAASSIDILCYQVNQAGTKVYAQLMKGFA